MVWRWCVLVARFAASLLLATEASITRCQLNPCCFVPLWKSSVLSLSASSVQKLFIIGLRSDCLFTEEGLLLSTVLPLSVSMLLLILISGSLLYVRHFFEDVALSSAKMWAILFLALYAQSRAAKELCHEQLEFWVK